MYPIFQKIYIISFHPCCSSNPGVTEFWMCFKINIFKYKQPCMASRHPIGMQQLYTHFCPFLFSLNNVSQRTLHSSEERESLLLLLLLLLTQYSLAWKYSRLFNCLPIGGHQSCFWSSATRNCSTWDGLMLMPFCQVSFGSFGQILDERLLVPRVNT